MPLLSFERANQWVPLDFMLKTDKMKLPFHDFSFVKATAPLFFPIFMLYRLQTVLAIPKSHSLSFSKDIPKNFLSGVIN